jgi:hypothetical protein
VFETVNDSRAGTVFRLAFAIEYPLVCNKWPGGLLMYLACVIAFLLGILPLGSVAMAVSLPQSSITVKELIPLARSQKEFKIIDGKDRGKMVPLTIQADPKDEKRWQLTFGEYGRIFLLSGPGGALMMERMDLFRGKSYIVYDPALPILLPGEGNGAASTQRETAYKMYRTDTGVMKRTGRVTHVVKRVSRSQFDTPAGRLEGYHIELEHKMDMEYYSQLLLTVGLGCRLDEGLVYGSAHYKLKKLGGILTDTKTVAAGLAQR